MKKTKRAASTKRKAKASNVGKPSGAGTLEDDYDEEEEDTASVDEEEEEQLDVLVEDIEIMQEEELPRYGGKRKNTEDMYRKPMEFPKEWARPPKKPIGPDKKLTFMQTDCNYIATGYGDDQKTTLYIDGVTECGHSVSVAVTDFLPYFWIEPSDLGNGKILSETEMQHTLNKLAHDHLPHYAKRPDGQYVFKLEAHMRSSIMNYPRVEKIFYKVSVCVPRHVPAIRNAVELNGVGLCYEAKLDYVLRFMVDKKFAGGQWITINNWVEPPAGIKFSRSQYETTVHHSCVEAIPLDTRADAAPMRIVSFDGEMAARKGIFPTPQVDKVINLAASVLLHGQTEPAFSVGFCLKSCPIVRTPTKHTYWFNDEKNLLIAFRDFLIHIDYDISTGYNTKNFDWPYLFDRAKELKIDGYFNFLGKYINRESKLKKSTFQSRGQGASESYSVDIDGRFDSDMIDNVKRAPDKLRSYGLNAASEHYLKDTKMDLHYSKITPMWEEKDPTLGTSNRGKILDYCIKDTILPLKLWLHLQVGNNTLEMARASGVPMSYISTRGQLIRGLSLILRAAGPRGQLVPSYIEKPNETYPGATVLEPITGLHTNPIATLDFASLYPSIMRELNLSYDAMRIFDSPEDLNSNLDQYNKTSASDVVGFVKTDIYKGTLVEILENLARLRGIAKKAEGAAKERGDANGEKVFFARQTAIKLLMNSLYGFTAGFSLPCLHIPRAVTARGRQMLLMTKAYIETTFTVANGYKYDARVVYGDTDSVMCDFGPITKEEACHLADIASSEVTKVKKLFPFPHDLAHEKIYCPYLLMGKKRYIGLKWEKPKHWFTLPKEEWKWIMEKNDFKKGILDGYTKIEVKGIEVIRRDNARIVGKTMTTCINKIILESDPEGAVKYVHQVIIDLMTNKASLWDLVVCKSIAKPFAHYEAKKSKHVAVELAKRIAKRDPGSAPQVGDRVPYVITDLGKRGVLDTTPTDKKRAVGEKVKWVNRVCDKAEDPIYAMEKKIPLDGKYYLVRQLRNPLLKLFSPIIAPNENIDTILDDEKREPKSSKAYQVLFAPGLKHMLKRHKIVPENAPLFNHIKTTHRCLTCKGQVGTSGDALCDTCAQDKQLYQNTYSIFHKGQVDAKKNLDTLYGKCKACIIRGGSFSVGNSHNTTDGIIGNKTCEEQIDIEDISMCGNKDCETLYTRAQAAIDVKAADEKLHRFISLDTN